MNDTLPAYSHANNQHFLVRIDKEYKCVCELCSCGNHKCPRPKVKGEFDTSYANHYKNFSIVPQAPKIRQSFQERHYNPQALRTNYQETYVEKEREEPTMTASRLENVGREILKSGPFISNTSYKDEYKPFKIEAELEEFSPPHRNDSRVAKFEGQSSYKAAYHSLPMPKLDRYKHPQYKNIAPFTGSSSYKSQFSPYKIQPAILPNAPPTQRQVKFEGSSTYNSHFKTFEVRSQPQQSGCQLDSLSIPPSNYISKNPHLYYDQNSRQFI